jgi:flagellar biogenesis protein FliO
MNRTSQDGEMRRTLNMMLLLVGCAVCAVTPVVAEDTAPEAMSTATVQASNESRPLGVPNGIFSARPEVDDGSASTLSSLDPRENEVIRVVLALGMVVVLLLGLRFIMRRAGGALGGGGRPSGVLQVHGRYPMGRGQALVLLQVGDRMVLVHQGGGRMQTLTEFTTEQEVAELRGRIEAGRRGATLPFSGLLDGARANAADEIERDGVVDLTGGGGLRRRLFGGRRLA